METLVQKPVMKPINGGSAWESNPCLRRERILSMRKCRGNILPSWVAWASPQFHQGIKNRDMKDNQE